MRWFLACLGVSALALAVPASAMSQTPAEPTAKEIKTAPAKTQGSGARGQGSGAALTLDKLKLPSGAIMVLVEQAQGALQLFPKMVLLTPEKFQEMMDRISALERQVKADKKLPNVCNLSGRLDGDVVHLRAEYRFSTE